MATTVKFVIHDHKARRAGFHQDLRFQDPKNLRNWYSFAVPKKVPLKLGEKVLAIQTHVHTEEEALFQGEIPPREYGGGTITIFDQGACSIEKLSSAHIVIIFQGGKVRGMYHMVSLGNVKRSKFKQKQYLLFKSKETEFKPLKLTSNDIRRYMKDIMDIKGKIT